MRGKSSPCYPSGMHARALASLLALLAATACGAPSRPIPDPRSAVSGYAAALRGDDPRAAYDLLTPAARRKLSFDDFSRQWREAAAERAEQRAALDGMVGSSQIARLTLADGTSTGLVRDDGGWRLEAPLLSSSHAATPDDALRLFARAIEVRSLEGALRVLSSNRRARLRSALDAFVAGLAAHAGDEIVVSGDRAFLQFTDGKVRWKVTLVREEGDWRIDDIDRR